MEIELLREEMFTNQVESEFFFKSEYEYMNHEFNFKALEKYTSEKFVRELERDMPTWADVVKKFKLEHYATFIRFFFFLTDGIKEKEIAFVKAFHNKGNRGLEYYDIEVIDQNVLDALELNVKVTNKRKKKVEPK